MPAVIQNRLIARLIGGLTIQIRRFPQDRLMEKAVLLLFIQSAEDGGYFLPAGAPLTVVIVVDIDLDPRGGGKEVRRVAGGQLHRFGGPGVGIGKTLGHAGVALVFTEVSRDIFLVLLFQQAGGQGLAQIGVCVFQSAVQKLRDGAVPRILPAAGAQSFHGSLNGRWDK